MPIGSFQALQHRMVDMCIAYEQARSWRSYAAVKADEHRRRRAPPRPSPPPRCRSAARRRFVGQEAVQLHGGMGMTEEHKVSHYFKRLTMIDRTFGDADHHLDRFATA